MPLRYQNGYVRCVKRKTGLPRWEFLWREHIGGRTIRRTAVIGSLDQYPTEDLAQAAVNEFRMWLNENRNRQLQQVILVAGSPNPRVIKVSLRNFCEAMNERGPATTLEGVNQAFGVS